jgi:class 3 adenylate cyclase
VARDVRYSTSPDGVRIAYSVEGSGPPLLLAVGLESFALADRVPQVAKFVDELCRSFTVIRFDTRGCGLSQRDVQDVVEESVVADILAVLDAANFERVAIFAYLASGPWTLSLALRHPERVSHLVLYETFAGFERRFPRSAMEAAAHTARIGALGVMASTFINADMRIAYPNESELIIQSICDSLSGETYARLFEAQYDLPDAVERLRMIAAPTLLLQLREDPLVPVAMGQELAAAIPNAQLRLLDSKANHYAFDSAPAILDALVEFIAGRSRSAPVMSGSALQTVLFTDLVSHTEMMRRLGDERGRDLLREHERITRGLLKEYGGTEIKSMGDGFIASFSSVTRALDCAIGLQQAIAAHKGEQLQIRVGLNAGEPIEEGGDIFGSSVIMASRIAGMAGAGEILVPGPLRHLLTGKSYVYADRGEAILKGFEDPVRLYEVRWRE